MKCSGDSLLRFGRRDGTETRHGWLCHQVM
jgi:hypothetical protein